MADKGKGTSHRGFASMDPAKQREIASKGGHAAHEKGTAHEFTPEEARAAGRIGGEHSHRSSRQNTSTSASEEIQSRSSSESGERGGTLAQPSDGGRESHKNES